MNKKAIQSNANHTPLQLVFIKNAVDKNKQASKKQSVHPHTLHHCPPGTTQTYRDISSFLLQNVLWTHACFII